MLEKLATKKSRGYLLASVLLGLTACRGDPVQAAESTQLRSLLNVHPDKVHQVPGLLVPAPLVVWGRAGGVGWADRLQEIDGVPCAITRGSVGVIRVEGWADRDRLLSLDVASQGPTEGLSVSFNGVVIEELGPSTNLTTLEHLVPPAMWVDGPNELRLETKSGEGAVAVSRIETSEPREFDFESSNLASGVRVEWDLVLASGGLLEISAQAEERGTVDVLVTVSSFGSAQREVAMQESYPIDASTPLAKRLPLGRAAGEVVHIAVQWEAGDGDGSLELTGLGLFEDEPFTLPPILFISIDTLSAQNMSIHGYDRMTTPRLAEFVADSVFFEQARSNAPWTVPSYASQFTGLYPTSNRITPELRKELGLEPGKENYRVPSSRFTLAEMMRAAGYRTGAYLDNPWLTSIPGLDQGFDVYDTKAAETPIEDGEMGLRYVLPAAHDFIIDGGRPPFVIAQALDVHGPYHTRPPFQGRFSNVVSPEGEQLLPIATTSAPVFGAVPEYIAKLRQDDSRPGQVSAASLRADYDEKVLEMDQVLGEFFDELKQQGLYDELLIVLSADHGESMGDHDFYFRHGLVYDSATHVPLIVKLPGQRLAGRRLSEPVQLVDLLPTFAEWVGIDVAGYGHGRSLVPMIESGQAEATPTLSEANLLAQTSLVLGDWKLVVSWPKEGGLDAVLTFPHFQQAFFEEQPKEFRALFGAAPPIATHVVVDVCEQLRKDSPSTHWDLLTHIRQYEPHVALFDLRADPQETRNLAQEYPDRTATLFALLEQERERSTPHRQFEDATGPELSADQKSALDALGYVTD